MEKITVEVSGMMCGMCEAHINDAVRKAFPRRGEGQFLPCKKSDGNHQQESAG